MTQEQKTERVQLLMTPSEVREIDDWSFKYRVRGRSEAIRRLIETGLAAMRGEGETSVLATRAARQDAAQHQTEIEPGVAPASASAPEPDSEPGQGSQPG
jgi:metal-responsive CopG/Arc/MetJ family transcriptional regulator